MVTFLGNSNSLECFSAWGRSILVIYATPVKIMGWDAHHKNFRSEFSQEEFSEMPSV